MLRMFQKLKGSYRYVVLILALLFGQAYCDLALPSYTSDIINVGVQQGGIPDSVPDKIREESMDRLFLFMSEKEQEQVKNSFTLESGIYTHGHLEKEEREELNGIFAKPMLAVSGLKEGEAADQMRTMMQLPDDADVLQVVGQMPEEQREQMLGEMLTQLDEMPESIVTQGAITYIKGEYQAMGEDMDQLQMSYVLMAGLKMLLLAALIMAASILVTFFSCRVAAKLGHDLRNDVYSKVVSFSSNEMNKFSTSSLITRSTNDIQQVQMVFTMMFRIVLYAPILGVGGVLKVLKTESSMTWILGIAVALILGIMIVLFSVAMPKFKMLQKLIDQLNLVSREILTGIPVIRAFSREKKEEERFEEANAKLTKTNLFVNRTMTFMMPIMMLIMNGISVLIVYSGAYSIDAGNMQVGDMMAFIQYAMQIIMSFLMITMISIMLPRASVAANRIVEVLDTPVSITDPKHPKEVSSDEKGSIVFENVSFAYPGAEEEVLTDISFSAKMGETVAFIGSTGSGKSTLVNLIPRFFDVTHGKITVDGTDIRQMSLKDLRNRIGYVPQKGVLFSGTIDSNLRYGREAASVEEIEQASRIAQATEFISQKKEGLESPIAQGGSNVSGGQKQRLSIARAIAKKPEIYIFDDSFSALDYQTDVALRKALKEETEDATTLIVAQRISTIIHADKILVLDEGRVAGMGTHKELLKSCDVYQQIARSQLSKEELENE
ncbi:MAG: ABC transporter ATP-binding protein [Clostridia bacterium]|nr:ABC transporter ATP-binding protein [Clostridia bacterium]